MAVSKPMPKTSPTKYICQVLVIERMNRPKNRYISPRAWSWRFEFVLVEVAAAHARGTP